MTLKIAGQKPEASEPDKILYITFTDLYKNKQCWLEEKLAEGYRIFINPKKGRVLEVKLVDYR
jgi:hypothetical protein